MPISPARTTAFAILLRVERENAYASELLHASQCAELSARDHALATALVMGVLRWRSLLDREISRFSSSRLDKLDPPVLVALRMAAYQLLFLTRVPARAAVHESTELVKRARKRSAAPFVNAVLRKLAEHGPNLDREWETAATPEEIADRSAHPRWLVGRWTGQFGFEAAKKICAYDQQTPPTTLRLADPAVEVELERSGITLAPGRLLRSAREAISGNLTATQAFLERRLAIQDEASQLVAWLAGHGSRILDCCAAPGGKTRTLAALNSNSSILAVELHPHRAQVLRRLVSAANVQVVCADVRELPVTGGFDLVLVDVPCSGTGTLARNPEIKWRLKSEDFPDLQARQLAILQAAMEAVAPGGRLLYSTCSLEPEENEQVVERARGTNPSFRLGDCRKELERLRNGGELVSNDIDSLVEGPYLRTIPGVHPGDGFFAAILQRI